MYAPELTPVSLSTEETAQSLLFLYEPTLINQIGELISPDFDVGDGIRTAGVMALDACARHKTKMSEVATAVGLTNSHGSLLALFRSVIKTLATQGERGELNTADSFRGGHS